MVYSIVVTYNGAKWVDKCFGSLVNSTISNHRIFAIDNGSTDGTVDLISANFPTVEVIETGANLGFGKANNIGMRKALEDNADFVFLLNQDAWVEKDTLEKLAKVSEKNPEYGVLSPMHFSINNSLDYRFNRFYSNRVPTKEKGCVKVPFVNAAAWLLPKTCLFRVGGFATTLFDHYGEDDNYIQRCRFYNYSVVIVESCKAIHDRPQFDNITKKYISKNSKLISYRIIADINHPIFKQYLKMVYKLIKHAVKNTFKKKNVFFINSALQAIMVSLINFSRVSLTRKMSLNESAFLK